MQVKGTRNEAGWNSVYVAGKIKKNYTNFITNSEEFNNQYAVEKLIKNPSIEKNFVRGLSSNSKNIAAIYFFCYKRLQN